MAAFTKREALRALTITAVAGLPIPALASRPTPRQQFVERIAAIHPPARRVAMIAMSKGIDPATFTTMVTYIHGCPDGAPELYFSVPGKPKNQIVVNPLVAYEHGPVGSV